MHLDDLPKALRSARRKPLFEIDSLTSVEIGRSQIEQLLPHRGAMLLLDAIVGVDPNGSIQAKRRIAASDPVFEGHFPGEPVYPGALQIEAIGQAGLCMWHFKRGSTTEVSVDTTPAPVRLLRVIEASFLQAVLPDDEVTIRCKLIEDNGYTFITMGQMMRGDAVVSVGAFEAMILEEEEAF